MVPRLAAPDDRVEVGVAGRAARLLYSASMSMPVLDLDLLEELRSILDDAGVREIVDLYLAEAPRSIASLEEALGAGDTAGVRSAAHRLKGAASGVGALEVTAIARAFEQATDAGQQASIDVAGLHAAAARAAAALRALLA